MPPSAAFWIDRPAGVGQAQHSRHFVKGLAGRVVDRRAEQREVQRSLAAVQTRMPAADDQAHAGEDVVGAGGHAAGVDVGLQVIHGQERPVDGHAEGLGRDQPH